MGLRSDIQEALAEAFAGDLSDVVIPFSFLVQTGDSVYNPATDTRTPIIEAKLSQGIFSAVKNETIDGINVQAKDEIVIINGTDLPGSPFVEPLIGMEIAIANGNKYKIINPGKIMGGDSVVIIYKMQVRKSCDGGV